MSAKLFAPELTMPDNRLAKLTLPADSNANRVANAHLTPATFIPGASAEGSSDDALPTKVAVPTLSTAAPGCPKRGTRVLMIGDSLVVGLGPVVRKLARACDTPFHYRGVVGSHVTQWVQDHWLMPQLQRARPDVVMVSLGGNDFRRTDPEKVRVAVDRFVAKIAASGARLLWISPPTMPFPDDIGVRDMWRGAIGGEADVDWFAAEQLEIPRAADRIHPNRPGNRMLSAALWAWTSGLTKN